MSLKYGTSLFLYVAGLLVFMLAGAVFSNQLWDSYAQHLGFMPRILCVNRDPVLVTTLTVADSVIFLSYMAIPGLMIVGASLRPDLVRDWFWLVFLFVLFILSCGFTHATDVVVMYSPRYYLVAIARVVCAILSATTVVAMLTRFRSVLAQIPNIDQLNEEKAFLLEEVSTLRENLRDITGVATGVADSLARIEAVARGPVT